jgi:L-threo-3-deoxy-hexylosonate aldolase
MTPSLNETHTSPDRSSRPLLPGVYASTLTFFHSSTEDLDLATISAHSIRLARTGLSGFVTSGSCGEAVHLSREERFIVTATTRSALDNAGFNHIPLIVGATV